MRKSLHILLISMGNEAVSTYDLSANIDNAIVRIDYSKSMNASP